MLSISETELASKIRSTNEYDIQTVTKCIDLLVEILDTSSISSKHISTSRINANLVNEQLLDGTRGALVITVPGTWREVDHMMRAGALFVRILSFSRRQKSSPVFDWRKSAMYDPLLSGSLVRYPCTGCFENQCSVHNGLR